MNQPTIAAACVRVRPPPRIPGLRWCCAAVPKGTARTAVGSRVLSTRARNGYGNGYGNGNGNGYG